VPVRTIPRLDIPQPVIRDISPPVIRNSPPPVVNTLQPPVIDVPTPVIEYPTLDTPTREQYEGAVLPPPSINPQSEGTPSRLLPETVPILGRDIPVPDAATLITTGSTAAIAVATTMASTLLIRSAVQKLSPVVKKLTQNKKDKKKKKKIGKVILQFIKNEDKVSILQYSKDGTKVMGETDNVENYLRKQLDDNELYDIDNKIIIDSQLKESMTKDGQKKFNKLFCPSKALIKKLTSKFSI
jgi:hypothetical protein